MDDYDRGGHAKYSLTVHMIFVTKYRKKLFFGETDDDIKQFLYDAANAIDIHVIVMETDKDHVHMLIRYKPYMNVAHIASQLKQRSTYSMWKQHSELLKRNYWKHKILWSDGYFACSIGQVSQKTVEHYIQNQG